MPTSEEVEAAARAMVESALGKGCPVCEQDRVHARAALAAAEKVRGVTVTDVYLFEAGEAQGYRQGVEDAAKVAETYRCGCCGMDGQAAAAIRALTGEKG